MGGSSGTVYGHIMAATDEHAYIQPLTDIFKAISEQASKIMGGIQSSIPVEVKLASPFGQLAELARACYPGVTELAVECARQALQPEVLSRSSETSGISTVLEYIQKDHMLDLDIIVQLLIRTGRQLE